MLIHELTIHGPFDWIGEKSVFKAPQSQQAGIYLWAIPFKEQFLTYYVGQTGVSFKARFTQHTASYLDGTYRQWDRNDFVNGKRTLVWHGRWIKGTEFTIGEFLDKFRELNPVEFMKTMKLFLIPIDTNKRTRESIEASIAKQIASHSKLASDFLDEVNTFYPRREDEEKFIVSFQNYDKIIGLRSELKV
jgi:hypothetical protein